MNKTIQEQLKLLEIELPINYHCEQCGTDEQYSERYDAYFCPTCDIWLNDACDNPDCGFCVSRPEKPSMMGKEPSNGCGMKFHDLKTWSEYFEKVYTGEKTFEVRVNDRDYNVGDILVLKEYNPDRATYTGRVAVRTVSYILDNPAFVKDGTVVMALK
jgi:hypothetical protein